MLKDIYLLKMIACISVRVLVRPQRQYIDSLYDAEAKLRELTSFLFDARYQPIFPYAKRNELDQQLHEIWTRVYDIEAAADALDRLDDAKGLIGPSRYDAAVDIVEKQASETLFSIRKWLDDCSAEQCIGGRDEVDRLAEKVREVTGRECRYNPSSNDLADITNDAASCIHRFADYLVENVWALKIPGTLCHATKSAGDEVKNACRVWSDVSGFLSRHGLYEENDSNALKGLATGNRLHLRVGSSMNHAAELDLDEGTLDYYDTDENVVEGLMSVLDFVLNCEKTPYGMRCENVKKDNIDKVAAYMAMATSMDFRALNPLTYYCNSNEMVAAHHDFCKKNLEECTRNDAALLEELIDAYIEPT